MSLRYRLLSIVGPTQAIAEFFRGRRRLQRSACHAPSRLRHGVSAPASGAAAKLAVHETNAGPRHLPWRDLSQIWNAESEVDC